jgi:Ice-binding-like/MBG domain (YGX type)/Domain of unknown function (DUF4214)
MATAPPLGVASSFAILGGTTVTNTGSTTIVGNVGVSPGTSITGFSPGVVTGGAIHAGDAVATQAEADLATAYNDLVAEPVDTSLSGQNLGGLTLAPGVYNFSSAAQLSGTLTLDAQGNPNAVFVFQIGTALTTASGSSMVLINGAHSSNIFWQVGSSATIGSGTVFQGNILAFTSITLDSGADLAPGRALAINGAVTMDTNTNTNVFTTPLTVTANDQTSIYGAALPELTVSYTGFMNGDTAASLTTQPTLTTTASAGSPVSDSPYVITASGAVDPYYTISYVSGSLAVTPAPLTITADDQTSTYGAALPPLTANYSGLVNGDTPADLTTQPTLTTTATAASPVSGNPYSITASGAVDSNYTISYAPGSLAITPAPLIITADDETKAYGAALPDLTATYSGFANGDTSASLTTQPILTTTATAASGVAGSPYAITASGAADSNYAISYAPGTLTVTPAPLLIAANDQSELYGAALPDLTASDSGFVNGDTAASLTTPPTLTTTAIATSPAGIYPITASGAIDPNYNILYASATLTIVPTAITGTVYLDLNANGVLDTGEPGLAGRVVFLDLNHDGTLDAGDPTATTDANGNFTLTNSSTGAIVVLEATSQDTSDRYVVDQTVTNPNGTVTIGVVPFSPITPVNVVPTPFSSTPSSDANTAYVNSLYLAVLGRTGAASEVDTWLVKMDDGMTDQEVALGFVNSPEHRQNQVTTYYEEFLHRAPDPASVVWVNDLLDGVSEETVVEGFLDSPEYQAAHQDSTLFIDDLYLDVLGRVGEPTGVASWQAALASGATRTAVVAGFVESLEADDQIVQSFYSAFLRRQREPGTTSNGWVNMLEATNGSATSVAVGILSDPEFDQDATTPTG